MTIQPPKLSNKALEKQKQTFDFNISPQDMIDLLNRPDPLAIPTKKPSPNETKEQSKPLQDLTRDLRPKLYLEDDYDNSDNTQNDSPLRILNDRIKITYQHANINTHLDPDEDQDMDPISSSPDQHQGSSSKNYSKRQRTDNYKVNDINELPDNLLDTPTLEPRNPYDNRDSYAMPKSMLRILRDIAFKHATIHSRITNEQQTIEELKTHLNNETTPDYLIKAYKNVLNLEEDQLMKAEFLKSKIIQKITIKQNLLKEKIIIYQSRYEEINTSTATARNLFNFAQEEETTLTELYGYVDFLIADKLVEFERTQQLHKKKKEEKKNKLNKMKEEHEIPAVITAKEFNKLKETIKNLKNNKSKAKKGKENTKKKSTNKSKKKTTTKQDFHKGKQNKSRSAPPIKSKKSEKKNGRKN